MHSPYPVATPSDPTTPGGSPSPTALGAAVTAAAAGTPLCVVTIWLLETYGSAHGQPLKFDSITAAAIGSVGSGVIVYLVGLLKGVLDILQERLTRPPKT